MNTGTAALTFSLLALAPLGMAQQPAKAPTPAKEPFTIPAGEIKLPALIDRCAAYLDCNIVWHAREMSACKTPVAVSQPVSTDRAGCLDFLANIVQSCDFTLTCMDQHLGTLEVIANRGLRSSEIMARAQLLDEEDVVAKQTPFMPVTVLVPLQHTCAFVVVDQIRRRLGPGHEAHPWGFRAFGSFTIGFEGFELAVQLTGMRPEVAKAIRLVHEIDQPSPAPAETRLTLLEKRIEALESQLARGVEKPK